MCRRSFYSNQVNKEDDAEGAKVESETREAGGERRPSDTDHLAISECISSAIERHIMTKRADGGATETVADDEPTTHTNQEPQRETVAVNK